MSRNGAATIDEQLEVYEPEVPVAPTKKGKKGAAQPEEIHIPELSTAIVTLTVKGLTSLIVNKFSAKSRKQMVDKQTGAPKHKRAAKKPEEDYAESLYLLSGTHGKKGAKYGFPAGGFKKAAVSACRYADNINMTFAKGAFHVLGDMIEIECKEGPRMREDIVRLNSGPKPVADIRYRGEFADWRAKISVRYNTNAISASMIVNLFNIAGFSVGVGEWRPERSGSFGMFEVETKAQQ